jgi:hypothetical protein
MSTSDCESSLNTGISSFINLTMLSVLPVPQIVFYQAGVGTESQLHEALFDGEQPMCFCEIALS